MYRLYQEIAKHVAAYPAWIYRKNRAILGFKKGSMRAPFCLILFHVRRLTIVFY